MHFSVRGKFPPIFSYVAILIVKCNLWCLNNLKIDISNFVTPTFDLKYVTIFQSRKRYILLIILNVFNMDSSLFNPKNDFETIQNIVKFIERITILFLMYSQTWVNDHLQITTTCLQRPLFWGPDFNFHYKKLPLNNNHLSTTATHFGSRRWSLYTGLTVSCWVKSGS